MRLVTFFKTRQLTIPATWVAVLLWCGAIVLTYYYFGERGLSIQNILYELFLFLSTDPRAPLLYILAYTLQPFAFMPSTVFTVLAGSIFGFWPALLYTLIGANLSASAVYWTGRGLSAPAPGLVGKLSQWLAALRESPFLTVLFLRLAYSPFDVVNFVAGIIKLRYVPFVLGTALGATPGLAVITSLGTAIDLHTFLIDGLSLRIIKLDTILLSLGLFVTSLALAAAARRLQTYWLSRKRSLHEPS